MTKQEEIKEGIDCVISKLIEDYLPHTQRWVLRNALLKELTSQGVVIKVEGELPGIVENYQFARLDERAIMIEAGYTKVEEL